MTTDSTTVEELADRFFAVQRAADEAGIREAVAPDFEGWTTAMGGVSFGVDELVMGAKWEAENFELRVEDVRRHYWDDGFVQQCVIRGTNAQGEPIDTPSCMVVAIADGRISRLEEYIVVPAPDAD